MGGLPLRVRLGLSAFALAATAIAVLRVLSGAPDDSCAAAVAATVVTPCAQTAAGRLVEGCAVLVAVLGVVLAGLLLRGPVRPRPHGHRGFPTARPRH